MKLHLYRHWANICCTYDFLNILSLRYFEDDDDENTGIEYLPAPGSPGTEKRKGEDKKDDSEDELDAFMNSLQVMLEIVHGVNKINRGISISSVFN